MDRYTGGKRFNYGARSLIHSKRYSYNTINKVTTALPMYSSPASNNKATLLSSQPGQAKFRGGAVGAVGARNTPETNTLFPAWVDGAPPT